MAKDQVLAVGLIAVSTPEQVTNKRTGKKEMSLDEQSKAVRARVEREGWKLLEPLIVLPGVSRSDPDIIEIFAGNNPAYEPYRRLRDMINKQAFQVLVSYDNGRIGRSMSMFTYLSENCVANGIKVCVLTSGTIDEDNQDVSIALGSISATSGIRRLVKMRTAKMDERATQGLPTSSSVIWSHKIVRDELGRQVKVVVDESRRILWNDIRTLLLEGVQWRILEEELYKRYGHANDDGQPYFAGKFYLLFQNPMFWGHGARHFRPKAGETPNFGLWRLEPGHEIPPGVDIHYHVGAAVYPDKIQTESGEWVEDELTGKLKAELRRRHENIQGSARPQTTHRFSGLLICSECGYNLGLFNVQRNVRYRCPTRYQKGRASCGQDTPTISVKNIQLWLDSRLRRMIEQGTPDALFEDPSNEEMINLQQLKSIEAELAKLNAQARRLIQSQSEFDEADEMHRIYAEEISTINRQLKVLRGRQDELKRKTTLNDTATMDRVAALEELDALSVDSLWLQEDRYINQLLHRLFGKKRLVVRDGQIAGISNAPNKQRNRKKRPGTQR